MIIFARVNVLVWFVGLQVHRAELKESETSAVTAHSFLAKENRTAVPYPYEWKNEHEKRSAKDQCCRGGNDVEQSFQVMVGRNASQLEPSLERPERIDHSQPQITPMRLGKGFQRVNAR